MGTHDWEAIEKDREAKRRLIADKITSHCNDSSPHAHLREIGKILETTNDVLVADIITGGITNFSYKVYVSKSPDKALFAKLSFKYALWNPNPDVYYDVKRTANEYDMMVKFATMAPECSVKPYICQSIGEMMLIVTEWCCHADEQLGNQFIDGMVDTRVAPKLATSIAKLHCHSDFEPDFNDNVRPTVASIFEPMKGTLLSMNESPDPKTSRANKVARDIGKEKCIAMSGRCLDDLENSRDCLMHCDLHVFNLLVERKPSVETLENFGSQGCVYVCDWEMSMPGPKGRDLGVLHAFPSMCVIAHAINGHKDAALNVLDFLETLWDEYAVALKTQGNKTDKELRDIYRNFIGWTGAFIFGGYFIIGAHINFLPLEETATADQDMLKDSIGVLSIKLLNIGFGDDPNPESTLQELRESYKEALMKEVDTVMAVKRRRRQRRMSALRATGRRVSDAGFYRGSIASISLDEVEETELRN